MSITDELREVAVKTECANGRCEKLYRGDLEHIADRIDIAYKHAIGYVDDRDPETMAENGWVKLPVDADGVPIHIGDMVEYLTGGRDVVRFITLNGSGWTVNERGWEACTMRHHHALTVKATLGRGTCYLISAPQYGEGCQECSACGAVADEYMFDEGHCPNCGAKVVN